LIPGRDGLSEDPLTIVRGFYEGLARGTMDFGVIHPEIRWRTPASLPWTPEGQAVQDGIVEYLGLEEFGNYLKALRGAVDGARAEADTFLGDGDHVAVLGRECGTARRSGKAFAAHFAHVVTVEDARIIQLRGFIDTALLAQAFDTPGASIPSEIAQLAPTPTRGSASSAAVRRSTLRNAFGGWTSSI